MEKQRRKQKRRNVWQSAPVYIIDHVDTILQNFNERNITKQSKRLPRESCQKIQEISDHLSQKIMETVKQSKYPRSKVKIDQINELMDGYEQKLDLMKRKADAMKKQLSACVKFAASLLAFICRHLLHIELTIGKIGFLSAKNLLIKFKNGTKIELDSVCIQSSLISRSYSKLITLCLADIRFQADLKSVQQKQQKSSRNVTDQHDATANDETCSKAKTLQKYLSYLPFHYICVQVSNVDVMLMDAISPNCLFSSNIQKIVLQPNKKMNMTLSVKGVSWKLLRHVTEELGSAACLVELFYNLHLSIDVDCTDGIYVKSVKLILDNPVVKMNEDLFSILHTESEKQHTSSSSSRDFTSYIQHIPKDVNVVLNSAKMTVFCDSIKQMMIMELNSFKTQFKCSDRLTLSAYPDLISLSVAIHDISLTSNLYKLVSMEKGMFSSKLQDHHLDTEASLQLFNVSYNRGTDLVSWMKMFPTRKKSCSEPVPKSDSLVKSFLMKLSHNVTLEISDVRISVESTNHLPFVRCSLDYSKFSCDWTPVLCDDDGTISVLDNFNCEVLFVTLWCRLIEGEINEQILLKKLHEWHTPVVLGAMLIKIKSSQSKFIVQGLIDNVQLEWSSRLTKFLSFVGKYFVSVSASLKSKRSSGNVNRTLFDSIVLNFTSVNVFSLLEDDTQCISLRVDSASYKFQPDVKTYVNLVGICVSTTQPNTPYTCLKSSELIDPITFVQSVEAHRTKSEVKLSINDKIDVNWSTAIHMMLFSMAQEIKEFLEANNIKTVAAAETSSATSVSVNVNVVAKTRLFASVSSNNSICIEFDDVSVNVQTGSINLLVDEFRVFLNEHDVFVFKKLDVKFSSSGYETSDFREEYDGLLLQRNKSWLVDIDEVCIQFPYQFNFAQVVSEEAVSIIKWLKLIHKHKSSTEGTLPADLIFRIKDLKIVLKDDPFETRLRDIYELLEDEHKEWGKRKQILDDKIEAIRKSHLLLPAGKLEELYDTLATKNADIYIKRSNELGKNSSEKPSLCLWHSIDIQLVCVADPSYHGHDNVIKVMQEIDRDSPLPKDITFSTLWCRMIHIECQSLEVKLRDFPQSLIDVKDLLIWGKLVGAEQDSTVRAKRTVCVEVGEPWCNSTVERGMQYLKFFHDFSSHIRYFSIAYGLCWEPVLSQVSQAMEFLSNPSADPSPPLTFWDKTRLLNHGRFTLNVEKLSVMLHASLDPYNTTEEMEIMWQNLYLDWTNAKFHMRGDMDILVHTASKYDDCRLVHLPDLKLTIKLDWLCLGHPFDHHSVVPCASDKIPEYSINQKHDSFRAFRSEKLDMSMSLETKQVSLEAADDVPSAVFYASTMRWFENLKMILSGVSRPTRRGILFNNTKPRKQQLSRHYRNIRLSIILHKLSIHYWMSFAKERGFELNSGRLSLSSEHNLSLVDKNDGLIHRTLAVWSVTYMNCELNDAEMWLASSTIPETSDVLSASSVEKSYFLSVPKVSYGREASFGQDLLTGQELNAENTPTHRLVVHNLCGSWTMKNRDIIFSILDAYQKSLLLKRNLSTDALKSVKVENNSVTPSKARSMSTLSSGSSGTPATPLLSAAAAGGATATPSPLSRLQSGQAANMLHKLIAEADSNVTVYTEELTDTTKEQQLHGVAACQTDDVLHKNWLIELVNCQVMLKGSETSGYVIISAAKAQILQRVHRPVWRNRSLGSKTTWVGSLECMQYYATVDAGDLNPSGDNIMWLTLDNIEDKDSLIIADLPDMVGSGQSVGGVVSNTVGATDVAVTATDVDTVQLQRIVSRCNCQFFYASYGEDVNAEGLQEAIPLPENTNLWEDTPVDSFTLVHNELNCCANSQQYAMVLDIVDNLLLHTEPKKKETYAMLQRMRFQLQLSSVEDQRKPILQLQNQVRILVQKLRRLQKESYLLGKAMDDVSNDEADIIDLQIYEQLESMIEECKNQLSAANDELALMISCFKETQMSAQQTLLRSGFSKAQQQQLEAPARRNEVCFRHAKWRLTEADGQLGIADIVLAKFLYSKTSKNDDSVEHLQELGYIKIENLLPNQFYKVALQPTELQGNIPLDRQRVLRVYCRDKPPVGGISIKEHFEINVTPFTISITYSFFKSMLRFFFPGRESENSDSSQEEDTKNKKKQVTMQRKSKSDDIEKMKERAEQNKLFLYIKIPEVPLRVSYKGEKEKNIEDVNDFSLLLPTLEYHSVTWTWLDFLMNFKSDSKKVLLSQAIKQKLQIKVNRPGSEDMQVPQEEDKARMLFGSKLVGGVDKGTKKGLFGKQHK